MERKRIAIEGGEGEVGGDTLVESRLLTGANGLPNNRPSSMHHRSFDRIAAPSFEIARKKKKGKEKKIIIPMYTHTSVDVFTSHSLKTS